MRLPDPSSGSASKMADDPEPSRAGKRRRVEEEDETEEADRILSLGAILFLPLYLVPVAAISSIIAYICFLFGVRWGREEESLTFSDTLVALRIMRAQFPRIDKVSVQPFVLRSQLYSSVKDRTQVDRELECLRREKVLRVFKLNTGQDDHAIMFLDDYLIQMECVVKRMEEKKQGDLEVFEWFKRYLIEDMLEPSIHHRELCLLLSHGGEVKDAHISRLINGGLLTRQLIDPDMYWFAIPNIGPVLKGLSQGRKELLSMLNRRKYKEMMLSSLEKMRVRLSPLDMRFHLRDLIGSGHLKTVNTASGLVVRVSKN